MTEARKLKLISDINRALGMIEGISCGLSKDAASCLIDAVQMIDEAMEEVSADG